MTAKNILVRKKYGRLELHGVTNPRLEKFIKAFTLCLNIIRSLVNIANHYGFHPKFAMKKTRKNKNRIYKRKVVNKVRNLGMSPKNINTKIIRLQTPKKFPHPPETTVITKSAPSEQETKVAIHLSELTQQDNDMIEDILNMLEQYGIADSSQRQSNLQEIYAQLFNDLQFVFPENFSSYPCNF